MAHTGNLTTGAVTHHDGTTGTMTGNFKSGFNGPVVVLKDSVSGKPTQVSAARFAAAVSKTIDQCRAPSTIEARATD